MKWLALTMLLVFSGTVYAQDTATLTWTNATLNTDSSPLTDLVSTRIDYGICVNGAIPTNPNQQLISTTVPGASESWTTPMLAPGEWCFAAKHINSTDQESDYSGTAIKTILSTVPPQPPVGLTVQAGNLVVYAISQTIDAFVLFPVGTVPEGTPCQGSMTANGYYLVPRNLVTWAGSYQPPVVFAECL